MTNDNLHSSDEKQAETSGETLEAIRRELANVPQSPGVYLWKNAAGEVIYVGKAKSLRNRMRQYVNFQDERAKIPLLVNQIASFDYIVTESEHESLVLELNLINQYHPYFNADFKDDKSYPYIAITKGDVFPAIKYTREKHRRDTRYFGPYTDSRAARQTVDIARRIVPLCSANCARWKALTRALEKNHLAFMETDLHPCFDATVGLGPGACIGAITPETYWENVAQIEHFLEGHQQQFIDDLQCQMQEAAEALDFERASRIRSRIETIHALDNHQHAIIPSQLNADVVGLYREETITGAQVLMVREGRIINANEFILNRGTDIPDEDLIHSFLLRYYGATTSIPHEVIVEKEPEDSEALQSWLTEKLHSSHGAKVRLVAPRKGEKAELLSMAQRNARHALLRYKVRTNYDDKRINDGLLELESALALERAPLRIECYDISTIHGSYTVASMVVFTNGQPDKNAYRRFRIKTPLDEANDVLSMQEVLRRRFAPERLEDQRFGEKPDLIIVDGGKPQLNATLTVFDELGVDDVAVAGLAKRDEELFVPWSSDAPVVLPGGSASLYLVKAVRDEAHRFAITYHRQLRDSAMTTSILDSIAGLGPVRKKALLKNFKSFRRLKTASLEELLAVPGIPDEVAREVFKVLRQYNETTKTKAEEQAAT